MADTKISDLTAITGANTAADDDFVVVDTSAAQTKRITRDELRVGLYPGIDDNSSATAVTIDASGDVGINEASPTANLHVDGDMILDVAHPSSTSSLGIGTDALEDSSAASATAIGVSALKENTTGQRNTAVGNLALRDNTTSANSTAVGYNALAVNNGGQNQAFGAFTLDSNTTGIYNTAMGYAALSANVSGNYNVAVGGRGVLDSCVSGLGNVAVGGYSTLGSLDDGDYNVALGHLTGQTLEGGSNNVLIGRNAGYNIVDADSNVCIGYVSGNDISSGQVNTCVGFNAGNTLSTGSNNTLLGRDATPSAADVDNEITLGSSSVTALRVPGVDFYIDDSGIGIGTSSPDEALHISKGGNSSIRLGEAGANYAYRLRANVSSSVNGGFLIEDAVSGDDLYHTKSGSTGYHIFTANGTEAMRIDSSGNVGVGTSSPSEALTVIGNGVFGDSTTKYNTITINGGHVGDGANDYGLTVRAYEPAITLLDRSGGAGSGQIRVQSNGAFWLLGDTTNDGTIGHTANTTDFVIAKFEPDAHVFNISGSAAMSIDSSGNVGIGTSSSVGSNSTSEGFWFAENEAARFSRASNSCSILNRITTTGPIQLIRYNGSGVGSISVTASSTAYNTSSDYRLKENVVGLGEAIDRVKLLKPSRFNFIADPDTTVDGFVAHEVSDIVPEAVTGTKDAMRDEEYEVTPAVLDEDGNEVTPAVIGTRSVPDYQGIDQSKLVPLLTAALQEALTEINDLKARVTALEG